MVGDGAECYVACLPGRARTDGCWHALYSTLDGSCWYASRAGTAWHGVRVGADEVPEAVSSAVEAEIDALLQLEDDVLELGPAVALAPGWTSIPKPLPRVSALAPHAQLRPLGALPLDYSALLGAVSLRDMPEVPGGDRVPAPLPTAIC